jgi:hypothetical protein
MTTQPVTEGAPVTDVVSCLRDEIVQSENARLDFIKWKILLIAVLGAVGLGLASDTKVAAPAILGFIPIACAYVDVVCAHVNFRILLIGHFLRNGGKAFAAPDVATAAYEALCEEHRTGFRLESIVLWGTTFAMCLLVASIALESRSLGQFHLGPAFENMPAGVVRFLLTSAGLGIVVSSWASVYKHYEVHKLVSPTADAGATSVAGGARRGCFSRLRDFFRGLLALLG